MRQASSAQSVRRVVTGLDSAGRSTIVSDEATTSFVARPDGSVVMDLWRTSELPTRFGADDGTSGAVLPPPPAGLIVRACRFAPNSEMDADDYEEALAAAYGVNEHVSRVSGAPAGRAP
jgi:hypothetical protein